MKIDQEKLAWVFELCFLNGMFVAHGGVSSHIDDIIEFIKKHAGLK